MNQIERDAALIRQLGGPAKVVKVIGSDKKISVQRVQNWLTRGIPSQIKVEYPHIFMPELSQAHGSHAPDASHSVAHGA